MIDRGAPMFALFADHRERHLSTRPGGSVIPAIFGMNRMKNTSLTTAEREQACQNDAEAGAPSRAKRAPKAPSATAPALSDLDEIHYQALLRLGHDRRRYPSEK
jgi:hypothetical protein